jgi:hypothetical protein
VIIFEKPAEASKRDDQGKNATGEDAKRKAASPGEPAAENRSQ